MSTDGARNTTIRFTEDMLADGQFVKDYLEGQHGFVLSETELIRVAYRHLRRSIEAHHFNPLPPPTPVAETPKPSGRGRRKKES